MHMRPITSIRDRHPFSQRDVRDARPAGTKTGDLSGLTELGGSSKRNPKTGEEEEVVVNAQGNDPRGFFEVSGSYDTEYKNQIDAMMQEYRTQIQDMQQAQRQARANNDAQAFQTAQFQMMDMAKKTEAELKEN